MKLGGISTSEGAQVVLRWVTLFVPLFIALYTYLNYFGYLPTTMGYDVSLQTATTFIVLWLVFAVVFFVYFRYDLWNAAIRLILFTILGGLYVALFIGVAFPITPLWVILVLAYYGYFGIVGAAGSLVALLVVTVADVLLHEGIAGASVGMAITITIISVMIVALMRVQERDEDAYIAARDAEILQRDSLLTLVNNLNDAVLSIESNGTIRTFNAATISLFDTNASLVGVHIDDIILLKNAESQKKVRLSRLLQKSTSLVYNDEFYTTINEEDMRLGITYSPIRNATGASSNNSDDGYIVILRDITKQKSLEEERDEFISVVSHELRTPITAVEGSISNIEVMYDREDIPKERLQSALHMAHEQIVYLAKMVNDLSTLSRAERGVSDEKEEIDVEQLLHDLYNAYLPEAQEKGLTLDLDISGSVGTIMASRLYLHEMLQNFVTNSIKYTANGGITIGCKAIKGKVYFRVTDTGIGISKHDQSRVFEKFYRSEDYRTRESSGTGLGLHVASKLARKLNTEIDLKSRLNHGSTFSFSLPQHSKKKS